MVWLLQFLQFTLSKQIQSIIGKRGAASSSNSKGLSSVKDNFLQGTEGEEQETRKKWGKMIIFFFLVMA